MPEYYEATAVNKILEKLSNEPAYYHTGETFFAGVSAVEMELICLPKSEVRKAVHGSWRLETDEEMPDPLFKLVVCSECGKTTNDTFPFCPYCGAIMDQKLKSNN